MLRHLSSSSSHPPALPLLNLKPGAPDEVQVALEEGGAAWILKLPSDQIYPKMGWSGTLTTPTLVLYPASAPKGKGL